MPSVRSSLESAAQAERIAKRRLPRPVYLSLVAGNDAGLTMRDNTSAFDAIGLRPRVGNDVAITRELSTTLLGHEISMPVALAPVGVQAVAPEGELPAARAAGAATTLFLCSSFASSPFAHIRAATPLAVPQLYWVGSRDQMELYVGRARQDGATALVLTVDCAPGPAYRDWGTPRVPDRLGPATLLRFAPAGLSRPRWTLRFLLHGGLPNPTVPNLRTSDSHVPSFVAARAMMHRTKLPTWDDIAWLCELWGGPLMLKGVTHPDDARRAVDAGASAVSVSNHGGNNLDSTPSALRALPAIARAVGQQVEVAYDGGVRRGSDVAKALALGARSVLIGRPWVFALAARGEGGVRDILQVLRDGLDRVVAGLGHSSVHDLGPQDLVVPADFALEDPVRLPWTGSP
jgi:heme/flavin dehydrogenase (mycofactocin system)